MSKKTDIEKIEQKAFLQGMCYGTITGFISFCFGYYVIGNLLN